MPCLTIECVCPPHTSMMVHSRVRSRSSCCTTFLASASSRYSSRYFTALPLGLQVRAIDLSHDLPHLLQQFVRSSRLLGIDRADGEADVDQRIIADGGVRDVL